ncbi:hypothetical protein EJ04DRAFT_520750 [Polyplosphaeria fusca]|uniref:Uncharacterized protein n=1 Tax=Polyplosphaeria fusca TaxID=682080 RepID=A0A9P4R7N9_9PLEO|nr:hypothetical protein EJ04DRAFT_520750 [Polyplosphaeria fusca]
MPPKSLATFVSNLGFLIPFISYQDCLPPIPGTHMNDLPHTKEDVEALVLRTYNAMDSMAFHVYDRSTVDEQKKLTPPQHFECLIYRSARNLARPGGPFGEEFARTSQENEPGRNKATTRIRGLIMLALNLTTTYMHLPPCILVQTIEHLRPVSDPDRSPLPYVREKHALRNANLGDLRKAVLDNARQGKVDEKEWLIDMLMKQGKGKQKAMTPEATKQSPQGANETDGKGLETCKGRRRDVHGRREKAKSLMKLELRI